MRTAIQPTRERLQSNSLPDLAARIRAEHEATIAALKSSIVHAMAAGDLLIEARSQIPHGQWLPWFKAHCSMSERSAQLYMKLAKNRATIEKEMGKSAMGVADLTLNEAAALCVLAGRLEKLIEFAKRAEATDDPEALISLCVAEGFPVIRDSGYDAFAGRSEAEIRDWILFGFFLGGGSENAFDHVEWLLQRPFQSVEEWLGPEGDKFRFTWHMHSVESGHRKHWAQFQLEHAGKTREDIEAEIRAVREAAR